MAMFWRSLLLIPAVFLCLISSVEAQRIKDIASVAGVRSNQLVGYGLVMGAAGDR